MANRYNFFYFEAEFKKYLAAGNAEESTIKNYLCDLHYFFSWLQSTRHVSELDHAELSNIFIPSLVESFHDYLASSAAAQQTIVRRLATLRKFFSLCIDQQWLRSNPAVIYKKGGVHQEKQQLLTAYQEYLGSKAYSKSEIDRHINIISSLIIN